MKTRCNWAINNSMLLDYHDFEWGVPVLSSKKLFEYLSLDIFQSGLSWSLILKKRKGILEAFNDLDPYQVSRFGNSKVNELLNDARVIRNPRKINAIINNSRIFVHLESHVGEFSKFIWSVTSNHSLLNKWVAWSNIPAFSEESRKMSENLKEIGFQFVGPVICYAFMQTVGIVLDHQINCFCYHPIISQCKSLNLL